MPPQGCEDVRWAFEGEASPAAYSAYSAYRAAETIPLW